MDGRASSLDWLIRELPADSGILEQAGNLGASLARAIREKKEFPEQLKRIELMRGYFREIMIKRKDRWGWEYQYWQQQGWL
jgi:hypothetical protein